MGRKRKKKKNPYLGDDPLSKDLVSPEEVMFRDNLLGEYDDEVFGKPGGKVPPGLEGLGTPPAAPELPERGPVDDLGLTDEDKKVIPSEMLISAEVARTEGEHFTLFVSEVTTSVKRVGPIRVPVLKFKLQMAMVKYYMTDIVGGSKRPAIDHAPITDFFTMELPVSFLPTALRKFPDMVSPALATKVLNQMMDKYSWSTIKPAPKSDVERLVPLDILKKMKGPPKGL